MRAIALLCLISLYPAVASAQSSFLVHGAAGPTLTDKGYSLAAGVGFSPMPRLTFAVDLDVTHLPTELRSTEFSTSHFRGGTLTLAALQVRLALFKPDRVGPYGFAGVARGRSRPNVNEHFPTPVTHDVGAVFFGGGLQVPLKNGVSLFADLRVMVGAEGPEGIVGVVPLRAGLAWRF